MELKDLLARKEQLSKEIMGLQAQILALSDDINGVCDEIEALISDPVTQSRQLSGKITGTVEVLVQGIMVKHCVSKQVVWDQAKMAEIRQQIIDGDHNPDDYMDAKTPTRLPRRLSRRFRPK